MENIADAQRSLKKKPMGQLLEIVVHVIDEVLIGSYVNGEMNMTDGANGAAAPGAASTPQKRGPPPSRTRGGGRLPTWTAAKS